MAKRKRNASASFDLSYPYYSVTVPTLTLNLPNYSWVDLHALREKTCEHATSKPAQPPHRQDAFGLADWYSAPYRLYSELGDTQAVRAALRRDLLSRVREWPRCKGHNQACEVVYKRLEYNREQSPYLHAAFCCAACERYAPLPRPVP